MWQREDSAMRSLSTESTSPDLRANSMQPPVWLSRPGTTIHERRLDVVGPDGCGDYDASAELEAPPPPPRPNLSLPFPFGSPLDFLRAAVRSSW